MGNSKVTVSYGKECTSSEYYAEQLLLSGVLSAFDSRNDDDFELIYCYARAIGINPVAFRGDVFYCWG